MILPLLLRLPFVLLFLPVWLIIFLFSALNELLFTISRPLISLFSQTTAPVPDAPVRREASIVILNWNGRSLMEECLPSVVEAVAYDGGSHEILVIDNGSTDDSAAFLSAQFPDVKVVRLDKNYGFVQGYNLGIKAAQKDILVFLNNDMAVKRDFLAPLLDGFTSPDVFAVSGQIFFWDPSRVREETGKTRAVWTKGWVAYKHDLPTDGDLRNRYTPAFWLGGGSAAVDRKKFLALGGFNPRLSPFYMEDVDISYKAWKQGWKIFFCPASEVIHKHRSSSGRLNKHYIERVITRNRFLFLWENITDPGMYFQHLLTLPFLPIRKTMNVMFFDAYLALFMALSRLPQALLNRNKYRLKAKLPDREIFQIANSTFYYKEKFEPPAKVDPERMRILMVCPYFPSLRSGGGVRMYHAIRALSQRHEVSLLSFWDEEADRNYFPEMKKLCKHMVAIRRHRVRAASFIQEYPPALEMEFGDPQFHEALIELLNEEDFNIIQAEYLQTALQIPASRRIPRVITHHEVQNAALQTRKVLETNPLKKARMELQWMRWLNADVGLTKRFDQVVTLTAEDAWEIYKYDPMLPITVIPTGVDLDYFLPQPIVEDPHSLIYVGNFRHTPNIDSALFLMNEVMPLVYQDFPDARVYIVGANPPPIIQNLAKPDQVIVTGWVEDMRPFIHRANIYVFPIRVGVGLRNKILEAWAMGKPTITSRLGVAGLRAVHGENIWIAESAKEIAGGVCHLFTNPELRESLGKNARAYVEKHHAWEIMAQEYVDVYLKALREHGVE